MWNRVKFVLVMLAVIVLAVALMTCSSTLREWSPESKAEATKILWTPVPTWTPEPVVVEERIGQQVRSEMVQGLSSRSVLLGGTLCAGTLMLACMVVVLSMSARHVRATVQMEPTRAYARNRVLQLPDGRFYDPRSGSVDLVTDGRIDADMARIRANADADAEVVRMLVDGIVAKRPDQVTIGDQRAMEYITERSSG